jgi:hypothetical protein
MIPPVVVTTRIVEVKGRKEYQVINERTKEVILRSFKRKKVFEFVATIMKGKEETAGAV